MLPLEVATDVGGSSGVIPGDHSATEVTDPPGTLVRSIGADVLASVSPDLRYTTLSVLVWCMLD